MYINGWISSVDDAMKARKELFIYRSYAKREEAFPRQIQVALREQSDRSRLCHSQSHSMLFLSNRQAIRQEKSRSSGC